VGAYDELDTRLRAFNSAPFLFVGAGLARRYLALDGWVDLLKRMAAHTGKPYAYFATKANGDLPRVASEIAKVFHEIWWTDDQFEESRDLFSEELSSLEAPLKVEVARYTIEATSHLSPDGPNQREMDLLTKAVVDGLITTNYDALLEHLFPDYETYVGQDELLFSDAHSVGEIYKIHGSATDPESIVLTASDYERFNERNPYLAAKLLTIFVEHPVIFLGYSLSDSDVTAVLVSIAKVLTTENLSRLRDRLIFVKWDPQQLDPTIVPTQIAVEGFTIPVVLVTAPNFEGVFEVLSGLPRKFPARILRRLKEHVYDLVLSNLPDARMGVVDIDDARAEDLEVVFGVGLQRRLAERGYVGITREDLLRDVLKSQSDFDAVKVVREALPRILRGAGNTPVYRYLRSAGLLDVSGSLSPEADVDSRIAKRVRLGLQPFLVPATSRTRANRLTANAQSDLTKLAEGEAPADVYLGVSAMLRDDLDLEYLRSYLNERADDFAVQGLSTAWAKAVSLYDYYRYGPVGGTLSDAGASYEE
jgi:hypothetical protein